MTRALSEARSLTVLDVMIRVGYRGQHHNAWREIEPRGVSQATADWEREAHDPHRIAAGISYRQMVSEGSY